jgi:hypothetical protein
MSEAVATDLDQYRQSLPPARASSRWPPCPNRAGFVVQNSTGLIIPARCDRTTCYSCITPVAIATGEALAMAAPDQWVTLTGLANVWGTVRASINAWRRRLIADGSVGGFAYNVEPNPAGRGSHAHVWWRGSPLDAAHVGNAAERSGMGRHAACGPAFAATHEYERPTIEYGLKMVLRERPESPTSLWPSASQYLAINGDRLVHATRGFWRDAGGAPLSGIREARRVAHQAGEPGVWRFVADL